MSLQYNSFGEELKATVTVTIRGEAREVQIERYTPNHVWHIVSQNGAVVGRFRTGNKIHKCSRAGVTEHGHLGRFELLSINVHNRNIMVTGWADKAIAAAPTRVAKW